MNQLLTTLLLWAGWTEDRAMECWYSPEDEEGEIRIDWEEVQEWAMRAGLANGWLKQHTWKLGAATLEEIKS